MGLDGPGTSRLTRTQEDNDPKGVVLDHPRDHPLGNSAPQVLPTGQVMFPSTAQAFPGIQRILSGDWPSSPGPPGNLSFGPSVGATININESLYQAAADFLLSATTENLLRDQNRGSLLFPSSIDQAGIFVRTEELLRKAGVRGESVATVMDQLLNELGLRDLANNQGFVLSSIFPTAAEDNKLTLKGVNDGYQVGWFQQGALTRQGIKAEDYIQQALDYEDQQWARLNRGGSGPVYNKPDRRVVEDAVRSRLKLTVGAANESRVQWLADAYMRDDRRSWDSQMAGTGVIDPAQTVKEEIRKLPDYKEIHRNRPADYDEESWLPQFVSEQRQQGVQYDAAQERGIKLATVGVTGSSAEEFKAQRLGGGAFLQNATAVSNLVGSVMK